MLSFRMLGPLAVLRDDRAITLGPAKQRAVLARLLIHPGEAVARDRLVDALWGDDPPPSAEHQLHVYVSNLRKALGEGRAVIVTRPPGYALELNPAEDQVDAVVFEGLVREGRAALEDRPAEAVDVFERALAIWRGDVLADLSSETFVQAAATRLEELRRVAEEGRIDALLSLGRHAEAIPELESLVTRYPLRERLREQQILALYRSGRQAEALAAFAAARRTLAEELGIDPSAQLRSLEQAILRQDEELHAVPVSSARSSRTAVDPGPSGAGRTLRVVVAVGTVLALIVAVSIVLLLPPRSPRRSRGPRSRAPSTASSTAAAAGPPTPPRLDWSSAKLGGPGDQVVVGGARTDLGYLGVGYTSRPRRYGAGPDYDASVWFATAKAPARWKPLDRDSFREPGNQRATDVALFGRRAVVVGLSSTSTSGRDAEVWLSRHVRARWRMVHGLESPGDQVMRAVVVVGRVLVAGGFTTGPDGNDVPAVWTSTDGTRWVPSRRAAFATPGQIDSLATIDGGRIVAAGWTTDDGAGGENAAVWISDDDGRSWRPADPTSLGGDGDQQINAMKPGGPGLVAVGQRTTGADGLDAAVWLSEDGSAWRAAPDPHGSLGGPGAQRMFAVSGSTSGLVAGGATGFGDSSHATLWVSADGATWERPGHGYGTTTFLDGASVKVLMPAPDGFFALGDRKGHDAGVWRGRERS